MKHILFLLFLAFHATSSYKNPAKPNVNKSCQDIKCPSVDAPVCARVTNKNKSIHIIMVNSCEMEYMKCHQGLEASVVDMSNCGHEDLQTMYNIMKKRGETRAKRSALADKMRFRRHGDDQDPMDTQTDGPDETSYEDTTGTGLLPEIISLEPYIFKNGSGLDEGVTSEQPESQTSGHKEDEKPKPDRAPNEYDQFQDDCPTECPSRDVMVCAKCQHGVYKTFLSICHMRMFTCTYTDETLELITRYPCIMSAPFLSTEPNTNPKTQIGFENDEDKVLKFINCREKGDPAFLEGLNKLSYSVNVVYPKCNTLKVLKRERKPAKRQSRVYSTY